LSNLLLLRTPSRPVAASLINALRDHFPADARDIELGTPGYKEPDRVLYMGPIDNPRKWYMAHFAAGYAAALRDVTNLKLRELARA
jgi:hypothetical protein